MKKLKLIAPLIFASVAMYSCDCVQNVTGTVLDKATKLPIDSVYTQKIDRNHTHTYTDKNGFFELNDISGGFRKCPPMEVAITKPGYEIVSLEMENSRHDTIYLERLR